MQTFGEIHSAAWDTCNVDPMLTLNAMAIVATLVAATAVVGWWAIRGGKLVVFSCVTFVASIFGYFEARVHAIGSERLFNGASLEAFGLLLLFAESCLFAIVATVVMTWAVHRWANARSTAANAYPS